MSPVLCAQSAVDLSATPPSATELEERLDRLEVLGRVLYLAAHPDDENTRLITQWARGDLYDTAYLSLTRGGGGQNLIGSELRDALGVIRTQELLAARRIDGGQQFFTRARDFGFSKNAVETFSIWDRETLLGDVVWVIRKFQPDVIVTRFSTLDGVTHGHHTASAQLAVEAFAAAADPRRFPEQLSAVKPWKVKRVVWNTSEWFFRGRDLEYDPSAWMAVEAGTYLPLRGESPGEIAARSRSMHKSQGFGAGASRGSAIEYLDLLAGDAGDSLFSGIDTSWSRLEGGAAIGEAIRSIRDGFDAHAPWKSVPALLEARDVLTILDDSSWKTRKLIELDQLIAGCLGLSLRAEVGAEEWHPGTAQTVKLETLNRSPLEVNLVRVRAPVSGETLEVDKDATLSPNEPKTQEWTLTLPVDAPVSQPYWLRDAGTVGFYSDPGMELRGLPENPSAFPLEWEISVEGHLLRYRVPAVRRTVDPVKGELLDAVTISPAIHVQFADPVVLFSENVPQSVSVEVGAVSGAAEGRVAISVPTGWRVSPTSLPVSLSGAGARVRAEFTITPPATPSTATLRAVVTTEERTFDRGRQVIDYAHIPRQILFPPAETRAVRLELGRGGVETIGYLAGAGDSVAENLRAVGYTVMELDPQAEIRDQLTGLDAVVLGVRAANTIENIDVIMLQLFAFAEQGGTVIAQYNTNHHLNTERLAPYPLTLSRDRVTDETADVTFLAPEHRALHVPNEITLTDFDGWVQERGLYFPNRWDETFTPLIACSDPGEAPLAGGLLIAPCGKGHFVYSGISWFRQLPAGVPGAYRLFVNLLALSQPANTTHE